MTEKIDIEEFYDQFVQKQKKIGVSIRHRIIFKNLKKIGLKKNSNVLEVGCGIGTVSSLIIKAIPNGCFLGCDISQYSIKLANELYKGESIEFKVDDMTEFKSKIKFDFIVFPDVLEHIPIEQHSNLFKNIAKVCTENAKILINIPEPNSLNWIRDNRPNDLQIIDQSLSIQDLLNNTYPFGFQIQSMQPYSIHTNVNNYLSIVLIRNKKSKSVIVKGKIVQLIQNIKAKYF